jgi:CheY-like chemotaxis protein
MMKENLVKILLVEDNYDHAELILRSFNSHRIANQVYHVADGEEAIDFIFGSGKFSSNPVSFLPNLILLDLRIPKIDGLEVLRMIKSSDLYKHIPVVVLTSSEAEKDIAKAYNLQANSYLAKPLDFNKFQQLMDDLGFYWLGWNVIP